MLYVYLREVAQSMGKVRDCDLIHFFRVCYSKVLKRSDGLEPNQMKFFFAFPFLSLASSRNILGTTPHPCAMNNLRRVGI